MHSGSRVANVSIVLCFRLKILFSFYLVFTEAALIKSHATNVKCNPDKQKITYEKETFRAPTI